MCFKSISVINRRTYFYLFLSIRRRSSCLWIICWAKQFSGIQNKLLEGKKHKHHSNEWMTLHIELVIESDKRIFARTRAMIHADKQMKLINLNCISFSFRMEFIWMCPKSRLNHKWIWICDQNMTIFYWNNKSNKKTQINKQSQRERRSNRILHCCNLNKYTYDCQYKPNCIRYERNMCETEEKETEKERKRERDRKTKWDNLPALWL